MCVIEKRFSVIFSSSYTSHGDLLKHCTCVRSVLRLHVYGIRLNSYASHSFRVIISFIIQASKKWSNIVTFYNKLNQKIQNSITIVRVPSL